MKRLRVAMDTSVASRLAEATRGVAMRLKQPHRDALRALVDHRAIEWHISRKVLEEVSHALNPDARAALFAEVEASVVDVPATPRFQVTAGKVQRALVPDRPFCSTFEVTPLSMMADPRWAALCSIFTVGDAEHIYNAMEAGCDAFLTVDFTTILSRVKAHVQEVQDICGQTAILSPVELAQQLESDGTAASYPRSTNDLP